MLGIELWLGYPYGTDNPHRKLAPCALTQAPCGTGKSPSVQLVQSVTPSQKGISMSSAASLGRALSNGLRRLVGTPAGQPTAYRMIDAQLKRRIVLSPSLTRLVFASPDIALARTLAPDQRIKLFFPGADGTPSNLPRQGDWQAVRRQMSKGQCPPMRTYTIRDLRREPCELDVDFVLHGVNGPASAWATEAQVGDSVQMLVPNLEFADDPGGYEWQPPADARQILLIGDETALPALAGILEELADHPEAMAVQAFIEVPGEADCLSLRTGPNTRLNWLPRDLLQCAHGEAMLHAARELADLGPRASGTQRAAKLPEVDIEQQILWERASPSHSHFYAWVAGESAAVMSIRRHLITERGLDRRELTLMGYWRQGRSLN